MNLSSLQRIHVYPHTLTHLLLFYIEYGKKKYIQCNKPSNDTRRGFWIFDGESGTSALSAMAGWWKRQVWHCPDQFSEPPTRNHEPWLLSSLSLFLHNLSPFPAPRSPSSSSPLTSSALFPLHLIPLQLTWDYSLTLSPGTRCLSDYVRLATHLTRFLSVCQCLLYCFVKWERRKRADEGRGTLWTADMTAIIVCATANYNLFLNHLCWCGRQDFKV